MESNTDQTKLAPTPSWVKHLVVFAIGFFLLAQWFIGLEDGPTLYQQEPNTALFCAAVVIIGLCGYGMFHIMKGALKR